MIRGKCIRIRIDNMFGKEKGALIQDLDQEGKSGQTWIRIRADTEKSSRGTEIRIQRVAPGPHGSGSVSTTGGKRLD